jgi:hypothetical protein
MGQALGEAEGSLAHAGGVKAFERHGQETCPSYLSRSRIPPYMERVYSSCSVARKNLSISEFSLDAEAICLYDGY